MNIIKGSSILITGGAGFIGSHIIDKLLEKEVGKIIIYDDFSRGKRENVLIKDNIIVVEKCITEEWIDYHMNEVDYCIHLAALKIDQCIKDTRWAQEVMSDGTYNVVESCIQHTVKKLVAASSASIYGMPDYFPTTEYHHPYNNRSWYGALKAGNEHLYRAFNEMYGLNYIAIRPFNVFGPRMDIKGKYTEVFIKWYNMIKEGKPPVIYGDGSMSMDCVYVEDLADAFILALESDISDRVYNVGGTEVTLEDLVYQMLLIMDSDLDPKYVKIPSDRSKIEVRRRKADMGAIRSDLKYKERVGFGKGLVNLIDWLEKEK